MDEDDIDTLLQSSRLCWSHDGEVFKVAAPPRKPVKQLPAGAYEFGFSMTGPYATRLDLKQEELIPFNDGPCSSILDEVHKFWEAEKRYNKLGVPYRRGIMMYGPPGTGKSGIVRLVCSRIIAEDGFVAVVDNTDTFSKWIPILNKIEPGRKLVVALEDVDNLYDRDEHGFLQLLDGMSGYRPGTLFLATTNHLEDIPERIYRPSRFDILIEIGVPSKSIRAQYVARLCKKFKVKYRNDIVEASEGLSFAHVKEMLTSCLLFDRNVDEIAKRMKEHGSIEDGE